MISEVCKKSVRQVKETGIVQQTAFWSEVKSKQGLDSYAFDFTIQQGQRKYFNFPDESGETDILVIIQQVNTEQSIAYVPYGPELEPLPDLQGPFLEELSEMMRPYLPKNCILIRYDLAWESPWAKEEDRFDESGKWFGPPGKQYQEFRLNFQTHHHRLIKSNSNILPAHTIFMDLKKDDAALLSRMKPKTRYNIQLAKRKGVQVRSTGLQDIDTWYDLYTQTAKRNRIHLNEKHYFEAVLSAKADNTASPAEVELLIASANEQPLAAMFLVTSGNRGTYLYGASGNLHRNYMATYALQWEAMQKVRQKGGSEYDFFGVSPSPDPQHPLYGLYKFKTGFGGELYHRMGCWDYPLYDDAYKTFTAVEMSSKGYHL